MDTTSSLQTATLEFTHDTQHQQFQLNVNGHIAVVDYMVQDGRWFLTHSEVPVALRGQGVGKVLVDQTFEYLAGLGASVTPTCSYIAKVAKADARWVKLLA